MELIPQWMLEKINNAVITQIYFYMLENGLENGSHDWRGFFPYKLAPTSLILRITTWQVKTQIALATSSVALCTCSNEHKNVK